jgi:hypothetical protein
MGSIQAARLSLLQHGRKSAIIHAGSLSGLRMAEDNPQVTEAPPASKASGEPNPDTLVPSDVTIVIKGSGAEFKISGQASEIQKIGDLLRGRPKGWRDAFRTAVIAGAASLITIFFSSLVDSQFQFSSPRDPASKADSQPAGGDLCPLIGAT